MFSGVEESYENAIRPFGEYLSRYVSSRLRLTNLGWVVQDSMIHQANCARRPILLQPPVRTEERPVDRAMEELARLETTVLGLPERPQRRRRQPWEDTIARIDSEAPIERQLEILNRMYRTSGHMHVRDNFAYIAHRALHLVQNLPSESYGQPRLFTPFELFHHLFPDQEPNPGPVL
jgi:hypothetical protein